MGVCLSQDAPAGAWIVGRPMLNTANEFHHIFFGEDSFNTGRSTAEALIPAITSWIPKN